MQRLTRYSPYGRLLDSRNVAIGLVRTTLQTASVPSLRANLSGGKVVLIRLSYDMGGAKY